ncbi:MAG: L-seryl-tRNA(Sec) selenium transferase [Candidatus Zixiibacteriota bacterium]
MAGKVIKTLRDFPSVEQLLQDNSLRRLVALVPRALAVEIIREVVARAKRHFKSGRETLTVSHLKEQITMELLAAKRTEVTRVINATGIVVHTNLGRSPLPEQYLDAVRELVTGYSSIEFDLHTGARGGRGAACERYLTLLAGSEAATIVNNCAAALLLILNTLANRKEVLISRGELVQIGGGFRIPDILRKSGARLVEVGTTNITTLDDYRNVLGPRAGLILKVHKSNFIQAGFTQEVPLRSLVELGRTHGVPVANDLGSGAFVPTRELIGHDEPTVQQSVRDGADLTCFSGDKMVGGVQAGLIVGRADWITKIKRNPLFRTVRVDKFVFAMLERLLSAYLDGHQREEIKLWQLLSVSESQLYRRGRQVLKELGAPPALSVEATQAYVGGGALPEKHVPSVGIVFSTDYNAEKLMEDFRTMAPPVIGRIDNDRFILDLRAVFESELPLLRESIQKIVGRVSPRPAGSRDHREAVTKVDLLRNGQ